MWTDNFQRVDDKYKSILDSNISTLNNGRINLFNDNEETIKNRIKMFERVEVRNKATDYRNATSNILQDSKLSLMYFSKIETVN